MEHPDAAYRISLKFVPEAAQNPEVNRAIFDASLPYWTPTSPTRLGFTDPAIWPATADFLLQAGLMDRAVNTEGIWTNAFVEKAGVSLAP
jgi:ABC-type nitrate/sulfonate/bicarbonate transport system substrate-binding protein